MKTILVIILTATVTALIIAGVFAILAATRPAPTTSDPALIQTPSPDTTTSHPPAANPPSNTTPTPHQPAIPRTTISPEDCAVCDEAPPEIQAYCRDALGCS